MGVSGLARKIFLSALESVQAEKLIRRAVKRRGDFLCVDGKEYLMKKNVFVVGFGKAVYGRNCILNKMCKSSDNII